MRIKLNERDSSKERLEEKSLRKKMRDERKLLHDEIFKATQRPFSAEEKAEAEEYAREHNQEYDWAFRNFEWIPRIRDEVIKKFNREHNSKWYWDKEEDMLGYEGAKPPHMPRHSDILWPDY